MQSATTGARAAEKSAHFSEASGVTVAEAEGGVSKRRWRGDGALALVAGFATLEAQEEVLAAGIGGLGSSALSLSLSCLLAMDGPQPALSSYYALSPLICIPSPLTRPPSTSSSLRSPPSGKDLLFFLLFFCYG